MLSDTVTEKIAHMLHMAKRLHAGGHIEDARRACDLILRLDPDNVGARIRLGQIARLAGRPEEAVLQFSTGLLHAPDNVHAAGLLSATYREMHRPDDAERLLDAVLSTQPGIPELLIEKGRCRLDRGDLAEAQACFERAVAAAPDNAMGHSMLGITRRRLGDKAGAYASFRAALDHDPDDVSALNGIGNEYLEQERFAEAAEYYRRALQLRPGFVKAQKNLAYTLSLANDIEAARAAFERLVEIAPGHAEGRMDYGLFLLSIGEYRHGWDEYEYRWQFANFRERDWSLGLPRWDGSAWQGGHLLLWGEQGVGDHVLYGTLVADIQRRYGGPVTIAVEPRLTALFARSFSGDGIAVVDRGLPVPGATVQCPFGSLGAWVRQQESDFRDGIYLKADHVRSACLRKRYAALGTHGARLVGLSWRSGNWQVGGYKSLDLQTLLPVLRRPGYTWINLQYGDVDAEIAALRQQHGITIHQDPDIDPMQDLDGFAAQIAALDCVISSSNSTVHFAGALGVPCHVLLAAGRGRMWYWPRRGMRTSWYSSLHLLRQDSPGNWDSSLRQLEDLLHDGG